jgi:CRP/FNR family transcriptional regulator
MDAPANWLGQFPLLNGLDDEARRTLAQRSAVVNVPAGTTIFGPGKAADNWLLVLTGTVRVQQVSAGGREIILYRVMGGETCVLTTHCLLADETYVAEGIAETDVEAVAIPRATFEELLARSAEFRRFVFSAYSARINELLQVIQEVAFSRVDIRLAHTLLELADGNGTVTGTHQKLATELGTAREVISRQLHDFQQKGWIDVARGSVAIRNASALQRLAETV